MRTVVDIAVPRFAYAVDVLIRATVIRPYAGLTRAKQSRPYCFELLLCCLGSRSSLKRAAAQDSD